MWRTTRLPAALSALVLGVFLAAAPVRAQGDPGPDVEPPDGAPLPVDVPGSTDPPPNPAPVPDTDAEAARQSPDSTSPLVGTFRLTPTDCDTTPPGGSWFQMQDRNGSAVTNVSGDCGDNSYSPLRPGTDGGLVTDQHQPMPDPAFDGSGDALAERIMQPEVFFGVDFSVATNPTDQQTGVEVPAPRIEVGPDGSLSGDLSAWAAMWNNRHFNQGSPKPEGTPGETEPVSGTYDEDTGAFTIEWSSEIRDPDPQDPSGFDGFTGVWHLEGTFEPAQTQAPTTTEPDSTTTTPPTTPATTATAVDADASAAEPGTGDPLASTGGSGPVALAVGTLTLAVAARVATRLLGGSRGDS